VNVPQLSQPQSVVIDPGLLVPGTNVLAALVSRPPANGKGYLLWEAQLEGDPKPN
jgi:hypothetical protein